MTITHTTAGDKLRAEAAEHERNAAESFERCDTDGWASQAASGLNAQLNRRLATIADNGGNIVHADAGQLIALLGVKDLIVVRAGKCMLVCSKDRAQEVRRLVARLEREAPQEQ